MNAHDHPSFTLDAALAEIVRPGLVLLDGLTVGPSETAIEHALAELSTTLRARHGDVSPTHIPMVRDVRRMFHALHLDPTRGRPSSEALLRRVLGTKGLYRISNAVDVCNLCSLETLVPMGLYDLHAIEGDVRLTVGPAGAGYEGIRKGRVNVTGRPALFDDHGPFGAPTSDSHRTRVRETTTALAVVAFVPAIVENAVAMEIATLIAERYETLCGARIVDIGIVAQ